MNECSKCGKKLRKTDKVCPNCGKKVKMVKDASKNAKDVKIVAKDTKKEEAKKIKKVDSAKQNKKNNKVINVLLWILGFVIPVVGLILFLVYHNTKKDYAKNAGVGALVSTCIWAFLGLTLLIDVKGNDIEIVESSYQIYNADINEWVEATKSEDTVITVIGLTYCQYCQKYNPIINKIAEDKEYKLYWFDADNYDEESLNTLTSTYEISYEGSSPYTLVTKGGEVIGEHVEGYMDENDTKSFLSNLGL